MPRHPSEYGNLLRQRSSKHEVECLAGQHRLDRRRRTALGKPHADHGGHAQHAWPPSLDGSIETGVRIPQDPNFGLDVPVFVPALAEAGLDQTILDPRSTWADGAEYDATARKLVQLFIDNFAQFAEHVDEGVRQAAPAPVAA